MQMSQDFMADDSSYTNEMNLQSESSSNQLFSEQIDQQEDFELIIDFDDYSN